MQSCNSSVWLVPPHTRGVNGAKALRAPPRTSARRYPPAQSPGSFVRVGNNGLPRAALSGLDAVGSELGKPRLQRRRLEQYLEQARSEQQQLEAQVQAERRAAAAEHRAAAAEHRAAAAAQQAAEERVQAERRAAAAAQQAAEERLQAERQAAAAAQQAAEERLQAERQAAAAAQQAAEERLQAERQAAAAAQQAAEERVQAERRAAEVERRAAVAAQQAAEERVQAERRAAAAKSEKLLSDKRSLTIQYLQHRDMLNMRDMIVFAEESLSLPAHGSKKMSRESKWRSILEDRPVVVECISKALPSLKPEHIPSKIAAVYQHLSGHAHPGSFQFSATALDIREGALNKEEMKLLECLADEVDLPCVLHYMNEPVLDLEPES